MKNHPELINSKLKKIFERLGRNKQIVFKNNMEISESLLISAILEYHLNKNSDFFKSFNLDLYTKSLSEKSFFYVNSFMAYYYFDNQNYERAESYLKYSLKYVESEKADNYDKMCIYSLTAYFLKNQDIFISGAETYFIEALKLIKNNDDLAKISLLNSFAYYYHNIEKREEAIETINEALELINKNPLLTISAFTSYKNAGIIYTTIGDFDKAKIYFSRALECSTNLDDNPEEKVKLLNTLGYVEFLKGDFSKAFENYDKAMTLLCEKYSNTRKFLDETVKTLDNISNILKFMGNIDKSIESLSFGKDILERINSVNKVNEVHNLRKLYTDLSLLTLVYKDDYNNSKLFFNMAEMRSNENEHYVNRNKKIILQNLINLESKEKNFLMEEFKNSFDELSRKGKDNLYAQILLIEFSLYYYKIKGDDKYLEKAIKISNDCKISSHYDALYKVIVKNEFSEKNLFDFNSYPLNLINLLSTEKKELLTESRKSKHFEIIEEFISEISKTTNEKELFENAEKVINKNFFSRGLVILKKINRRYNIEYSNIKDKELSINSWDEIISTIKHIKNIEIVNSMWSFYKDIKIKSSIIKKIDYKDEGFTYYFLIFNEDNNDWFFNLEELKTFDILINNFYLKHKNLIQIKKIELNSITDYLTGFKNAAYYNDSIKILINNYKESKERFGIVIIDLNKFKKINDSYGHLNGDKVLKHFAKILEKKVKGVFDFIRYGGDEFILLYSDKYDIDKELRKLKKFFMSNPYKIEENDIFIDFSYGIEVYTGQSESALFTIADSKMYKQKLLFTNSISFKN